MAVNGYKIFEDYDARGWSSECQLNAMEREGIDAAMLPVQNVGAAVAEAWRAKEELGFPAVFIRPNPIRGR